MRGMSSGIAELKVFVRLICAGLVSRYEVRICSSGGRAVQGEEVWDAQMER